MGLVCYERFAWKQGSSLAIGICYGAGIVHAGDIKAMLLRALNDNGKGGRGNSGHNGEGDQGEH